MTKSKAKGSGAFNIHSIKYISVFISTIFWLFLYWSCYGTGVNCTGTRPIGKADKKKLPVHQYKHALNE